MGGNAQLVAPTLLRAQSAPSNLSEALATQGGFTPPSAQPSQRCDIASASGKFGGALWTRTNVGAIGCALLPYSASDVGHLEHRRHAYHLINMPRAGFG